MSVWKRGYETCFAGPDYRRFCTGESVLLADGERVMWLAAFFLCFLVAREK